MLGVPSERVSARTVVFVGLTGAYSTHAAAIIAPVTAATRKTCLCMVHSSAGDEAEAPELKEPACVSGRPQALLDVRDAFPHSGADEQAIPAPGPGFVHRGVQ